LNRCPLEEIVRDGLARNIADPLGFTPRPAQSVPDLTGPSRDRCRLYVAGFWPRFELHSRTTVSWRDLGKRLVAVADSQSDRSSLVTCAFGEGRLGFGVISPRITGPLRLLGVDPPLDGVADRRTHEPAGVVHRYCG
jgi:hypothetical protein